MLDISIVNETSPEANWNRQMGRQTDGQANLCVGRLRLQKQMQPNVTTPTTSKQKKTTGCDLIVSNRVCSYR